MLIELDEIRRNYLDQSIKDLDKFKRTFDISTHLGYFQVGDTLLRWDNRREKPRKHRKFGRLWLGPYIIDEVAGTNYFYLNYLEKERLSLPVNGFLLKMFFPEAV